MKKYLLRTLSLLLCLVCILSIPTGSSAAASKPSLVYLFINDTLIKSLTASNMPVRINNSMYISYRYLIRIKPIKYFYDEDTRILKVYTSEKFLIFDVGNSITYDQDGNIYSYLAEIRNGVLYVPIEFICRVFGVDYMQFYGEKASIIRINSTLSSYSNSQLLISNEAAMDKIYKEYYPPEPPAPPVVIPVEPDEPDEPEPVRRRSIYPILSGPLNSNAQNMVTALDSFGMHAAFFLSAEGLQEQGDLLRRILCSGYTVGIQVTAQDPVAEAEAVNDILSAMIFRRSRLVTVQGGSRSLTQEQKGALRDAGYILWDGLIDPGSASKGSDTVIANGRNLLKNAANTSSLVLYTTDSGRAALRPLLRHLQENKFTSLPMYDWTAPLVK